MKGNETAEIRIAERMDVCVLLGDARMLTLRLTSFLLAA